MNSVFLNQKVHGAGGKGGGGGSESTKDRGRIGRKMGSSSESRPQELHPPRVRLGPGHRQRFRPCCAENIDERNSLPLLTRRRVHAPFSLSLSRSPESPLHLYWIVCLHARHLSVLATYDLIRGTRGTTDSKKEIARPPD